MTTLFCPACRHTNRVGDRFCTACGAALPDTTRPTQSTHTHGRPPRRWLKWAGIGCGGLITLIVVGIVLGVVFGGRSTDENDSASIVLSTTAPSPTPLVSVNPRVIWDDYLANETRANSTWKGDWLALRLESIDEIEDGGRVLKYMGEFGWDYIELDFKNDDDVIHLNIGDTVVAICKLSGFELDSWLNFKDCKYPD